MGVESALIENHLPRPVDYLGVVVWRGVRVASGAVNQEVGAYDHEVVIGVSSPSLGD